MTAEHIVQMVARAISRSFHEEGYIEGVSDPSEWAEFEKAAIAALLVIQALPELEALRIAVGALDDFLFGRISKWAADPTIAYTICRGCPDPCSCCDGTGCMRDGHNPKVIRA